MVRSGLVTAWRFAGWPTSRSPSSVNATIDGVVRMPSAFSMTLGVLPSITATHELVVPRSIPMTFPMVFPLFQQVGRALSAPDKGAPPETSYSGRDRPRSDPSTVVQPRRPRRVQRSYRRAVLGRKIVNPEVGRPYSEIRPVKALLTRGRRASRIAIPGLRARIPTTPAGPLSGAPPR